MSETIISKSKEVEKYYCDSRSQSYAIEIKYQYDNFFIVQFWKYKTNFLIYLLGETEPDLSNTKLTEILKLYKQAKKDGKSYHYNYQTLQKIKSVYSMEYNYV